MSRTDSSGQMQTRANSATLILWMAILPLFLFSCRSKPAEIANSHASAPTLGNSQADFYAAKDLQEPYLIENNPALRQAWQRFTSDGRYRLARLSDMKFSESQKQTLRYWQSTEAPNNAGIAAIIIDTHQPEAAQFGIIALKYESGSGIGEKYSTYWVCREVDLSRAALYRASGYIFLDIYPEDGMKKTCNIAWSYRQHRYVLNYGCV